MIPLNFLEMNSWLILFCHSVVIPVCVWSFADVYGAEQKENNLPLQCQTRLVHFGPFQFSPKLSHQNLSPFISFCCIFNEVQVKSACAPGRSHVSWEETAHFFNKCVPVEGSSVLVLVVNKAWPLPWEGARSKAVSFFSEMGGLEIVLWRGTHCFGGISDGLLEKGTSQLRLKQRL